MWTKVVTKIKINNKPYFYYVLKEEQRTKEWHKAKIGRVTASNVTAARGQSQFKTQTVLADELCNITKPVHSDEALKRMKYGVDNESTSIKYLEKLTGYKITDCGLCINAEQNLLGFSPDGLIDYEHNPNIIDYDILGEGMIEAKNPQKMYIKLTQHAGMLNAGFIPDKFYHQHIFDAHYDQIQLSLYISKRLWCIYFVYISEEEYYKETVYFNELYTEKTLLPQVNSFIANYLLPRLKKFHLKIETPTEFDIDDLLEQYSNFKI